MNDRNSYCYGPIINSTSWWSDCTHQSNCWNVGTSPQVSVESDGQTVCGFSLTWGVGFHPVWTLQGSSKSPQLGERSVFLTDGNDCWNRRNNLASNLLPVEFDDFLAVFTSITVPENTLLSKRLQKKTFLCIRVYCHLLSCGLMFSSSMWLVNQMWF